MKRIIFKVSGESLKSETELIADEKVNEVCEKIERLSKAGFEVIVVPGAGNIWRGRNNDTMNIVNADNIGMLATTMNSIAIYDKLNQMQAKSKIYNSHLIDGVLDSYNVSKIVKDLEGGNVVILAGGSGLPLCSTDFACVQRGIELGADTILLGKSVDGVYDKDPRKYSDAVKLDRMTTEQVLKNHINNGADKLGVMDITAESLLAKYKMSVLVFDVSDPTSIEKIINGEEIGTIISE